MQSLLLQIIIILGKKMNAIVWFKYACEYLYSNELILIQLSFLGNQKSIGISNAEVVTEVDELKEV